MLLSKADFWHEVRLLATNNYGSWSNKEEAKQKIDQAVDEVISNLREELKSTKSITRYTNLLNYMMEGI